MASAGALSEMIREGPARQWRWDNFERKVIPYVFLAPFLIIFVVFTVYPVIDSFFISLHKMDSLDPSRYVGLDNYARLLTRDSRFHKSLINASVFALGTVFLQLPLSLGLALALDSHRIKYRAIARMGFFIPYITSAVVASMIFQFVFEERYGMINGLLNALGIDSVPWLRSADFAMPTLIIVGLWTWVGSNSLFFLAGLQSIPEELKEAARIDGATEFQVFWHVTFPLLRPVTTFVVTLGIIGSYSLFAQPFLLFDGSGPRDSVLMPLVYLYQRGFESFKLGYGAAIGYLLTVIIIMVTGIQLALMRKWGS